MSPPLEHGYVGLSSTAGGGGGGDELDLKDTELRLGLPGSVGLTLGLAKTGGGGRFVFRAKRWFSDAIGDAGNGSEAAPGENGVARGENASGDRDAGGVATAKAQIVGWPPIRSYRKNSMASKKKVEDAEGKQGVMECCLYVKVSMDGAPYLRKVDLKLYSNYKDLSLALEKMFTCFTSGEECYSNGLSSREKLKDLLRGSEYVLTYEDRDGDWMLVGDVPWDMFTDSCRRMRIMKGSEAIGIAPRTMEKSKSRF